MKKSIILLVTVFLIVAVVPISAGLGKTEHKTVTAELTSTTEESIPQDSPAPLSENEMLLNDDEIDYILSKVLEYADESTDKEAVKAVIALCKNNFIYHKQTASSQDQVNIDTYSDDFLEELRNLYKETDVDLLYNNSTVYIPITNTSPGYIVSDKKYPYIISVACPWDAFSVDYTPDYEYPCGISVNSIEYLCKNGSDFIDALCWHLPDFDITE